MDVADLAARAAREAAITRQINELHGSIAKTRKVRNDLSNSNAAIGNELRQWTDRYNVFRSSPMSEVVVTDKYEGESAEKIKMRLPDMLQIMEKTKLSAEGVQREIGVQISRLDTYIAAQEAKIAALRRELAAL